MKSYFALQAVLKGRLAEHALALAIYLVIALAMFWNLAGNAAGSLPNSAGSSYQSAWGLWWVNYATFVLHQNPYFTSYILYPIGANLNAQALAPIAAFLTWPLQQIGVAFAYNVLLFLGFALSGLFMYMLAKYITGNRYAAFIAGLIFAFAPAHIAQSYTGLQWTSVEFMPLFVLLMLMTIRETRHRYFYAVLSGASFFMVTFFGDIQQGAMMLFFAILALAILLFAERRLFDRNTVYALAIMTAVAALMCAPLLALMATAPGQGGVQQAQLSSIPRGMLFSDTLASFFLPSYYNGILGGSAAYYNSTYGLNYTGIPTLSAASRKVAYLGYTAMALAAVGIAFSFKRERKQLALWSAVLVVFALLALGPVLQITGAVSGSHGPVYIGMNVSNGNVSGMPMPYLLYSYVPVINSVTQPGAFDIVAEMALAMLAAIGVGHLIKTEAIGGKGLAFAVALSLLILIEYNGMPLSGTSAARLTSSAAVPAGFAALGNFSGNYSVLSLPALPAQNGSFGYPGTAMLYSTASKKPLVGGYSAIMNASQQTALETIPLVVQTTYLQGRQGFLYPYPINENYSNLTLLLLDEYGTGIVSMQNGAFSPNDSASLRNYLESIFGAPWYSDNGTTMFQTGGAISRHIAVGLDAYTVGTWTPGYIFCAQQCNSQFATMWWGGNPRGVYVYSYRNGSIAMGTDALSYYGTANVAVIDNGRLAGFINATNNTIARQRFSVTLNVTRGLNQVILYEPNSTIGQQNPNYAQYPYFNFGIYNMTVTYANDTTT